MSARVGPRKQFKILRNIAGSVYRCPSDAASEAQGWSVAVTYLPIQGGNSMGCSLLRNSISESPRPKFSPERHFPLSLGPVRACRGVRNPVLISSAS
jgi:hypothetical protein